MTDHRFCRERRAALPRITLSMPCNAQQSDHTARKHQIARLCLTFGLSAAQAALVAPLAFGERGAE